MAVLSSPLNFKNISKTVEVSKRGISTAGKTLNRINQVVFRRTKVKREAFATSKMMRDRRVENERRTQLEDEIKAPSIAITPGGAQKLIQTDTTKGFFDRILGFVGYLTAGWIMNNLPTIIGMGQEFVARLQKAGQIVSGFFNGTIQLFTGFGNVIGAVGQNIMRFDLFDTSNRLKNSFSDLNLAFDNMGRQLEEALELVTTPLTEGKYSGQKIPGMGTEYQSEGAYETQTPSVSGSAGGGQWKPLLDLIASKESGGNYEAMYPSTTLPGATQMTISEVASRATGAVGRYQQLPQYLVKRARAAGLNPDKDLFSPVNQDLIATKVNIGMNRGGNAWLAGKISTEQFMQGLSQEFAALPNAYGRFYYPRQGSSIKPGQVREALDKVKRGSEVPSGQPSGSNLQPPVVNAGPVQSVTGTWETGKGFNPSGAKDVYGRPVVLSRSAAEAFSAMMRDSKGVVKGSDVASSQRSLEKNAKVGGAVRSKHLQGLALDIHGPSNAWMRKYGPRYGWYANDYSGSHGGHFEFRGGSSRQTPQSPAQISAPPQQRASYPVGITPERRGQDVIIAQTPSQQNVIVGGGGGGGSSAGPSPASNHMMLNNFIKNKLLLDLAYL